MVTGTTYLSYRSTPRPGPTSENDQARRLSGPTTPPRPGFLRSIARRAQLAEAAKPQPPPELHNAALLLHPLPAAEPWSLCTATRGY